MRVLFAHGIESGPGGRKSRALAQFAQEVRTPELDSAIWGLSKRNSLLRHLLGNILSVPPWRLPAAAVEGALEGSYARLDAALRDEAWRPDVLVGSSWGGSLAVHAVARRAFAGPTLLLCPAVHGRLAPDGSAFDFGELCNRLAALPQRQRQQILIVHGENDETVPLAAVQELARRTEIELRVLPGADHRLGCLLEPGAEVSLEALVREVAVRQGAPPPAGRL